MTNTQTQLDPNWNEFFPTVRAALEDIALNHADSMGECLVETQEAIDNMTTQHLDYALARMGY